jgi:hypothetical protein
VKKSEQPAGGQPPDKKNAKNGNRLAAYLEETAAKSGVTIKKVANRKAAGGPGAKKYFRPASLQMTMEGKIDGVIKMIHALEKGDRFVRIDQIEFRRDVKADQVAVNLDISGYESTDAL